MPVAAMGPMGLGWYAARHPEAPRYGLDPTGRDLPGFDATTDLSLPATRFMHPRKPCDWAANCLTT